VDLNVQYAGNNRNNPLKILSNKQAETKKYISLKLIFPIAWQNVLQATPRPAPVMPRAWLPD
jgi:hypothetical protein